MSKLSEQTDIGGNLTSDDLLLVTNDPSGTPASRKATVGALRTFLMPSFIPTVMKVVGDATGDHSSASTTFVDINAAYSIAMPASVGDVLDIWWTGPMGLSANNTGWLSLLVAGVTMIGTRFTWNTTGIFPQAISLHYVHTVVSGDISGGTVTVKPQWKTGAATTMYCLNNNTTNFERPILTVMNLHH